MAIGGVHRVGHWRASSCRIMFIATFIAARWIETVGGFCQHLLTDEKDSPPPWNCLSFSGQGAGMPKAR